MTTPLDALNEVERTGLPAAGPPKGADTMKATLTDARFDDPDWIFERKLDGIRCLAVRDAGRVRLMSRNELSLNERYPELAGALGQQPTERFAVDGEVVAFAGSETSFARLAQRGQHPVPVFMYVFDVLWLDGYDVRRLPLLTRKRLLRRTLTFTGPLRWTAYRREHGRAFYQHACRAGWEGLIAKRAASIYTDRRSRDWLKFKCEHGQELVVGRLHRPARLTPGVRRAAARLLRRRRRAALRGQGGHRLRRRPAARASAGVCAPSSCPRRRLPARRRYASGVCTGWRRSWSRRSPSPNGRAPAGCATPASSACVTTSRPARWCASSDRDDPRGAAAHRADPSRQGAVHRSDGDQARPGPLLRAHRPGDAAVGARAPAGAAGLPGRHRAQGLLPEGGARLLPGLDRPRDRAQARRVADAGPGRERRHARLPGRAERGHAARVAVAGRRAGPARPADPRLRPEPGGDVRRRARGGARRGRAPARLPACPPTRWSPAHAACTSCVRCAAGRASSRCTRMRARWPRRWCATIPGT